MSTDHFRRRIERLEREMNFNQTNVNQGNVNNVVEKTGTSYKGYRPRHDYVLLRLTQPGKSVGGLALPSTAREGNRWHVMATGPKVSGLEAGQRVEPRADAPLLQMVPDYDLYLVQDEGVVVIVEQG